ncbi:hypothetical protein ACI2LC_25095 [Nonomuraea wenchangensis]
MPSIRAECSHVPTGPRGKSPWQAALGDRLIEGWIRFAATGDPNGGP